MVHDTRPSYACTLDMEEETEFVFKAVSNTWSFLPPENLPGFVFGEQSWGVSGDGLPQAEDEFWSRFSLLVL